MVRFVVIGAGMTGLSTAYHLKKDYFLAEKESKVGGLAGSVEKNGFIFDYAEHFLRILDDPMKIFFKNLMGDNIFSQELICAIYFKEKFIPYPFQENIRELPIDEFKKCAKSLIQNYCLKDPNKKKIANFEEYIYYNYGDYIANEFMIPYNEKIWCIKPREMNTSWFLDPKFIPSFNLDEIVNNILPLSDIKLRKKNHRWYPVKGGSQEIANSFLPHLSHLALNHKVKKVKLDEKIVIFQNNQEEHYESLISTIPLPELLEIIEPIPSEIHNLIPKLKFNSLYCMNLCLNHEIAHKYHWLYFPQKEIPFSRLFFSNNFSKFNVPKGKGSCSALTTYIPTSEFNFSKFEEKSIQHLIELEFLKDESEIIDRIPVQIKYGFALPTLGISIHLKKIQDFLNEHNIFSIGRYGEWKYAGIEHAIEDGKNIKLKLY